MNTYNILSIIIACGATGLFIRLLYDAYRK